MSSSSISTEAILVSETCIETLQLVGRAGSSCFLLGGSRGEGAMPSGPNPYELLSASLAACTAMTIRTYAERARLPLERIQVSVAYLRRSGGTGNAFERSITLQGPLEDEQRSSLLRIAANCPVGKILAQGADIRTTLSDDAQRSFLMHVTSNYRDDLERIAGDNPLMGFD
ncbi:MAG TPA: OsmC family protein [Steroidobacteraceae bacterium]|jgi:putative redox protein